MLLPLERDPLSGVTKHIEIDEDGRYRSIAFSGDIQPGLDHAANLRNTPGYQDPKNDMVHAAHVTPMLEFKLLCEHGIDISNPDHLPYAIAKIETDSDFSKARVGAGRMMGMQHAPKQHFLGASRRERHYGCELTKILDACH